MAALNTLRTKGGVVVAVVIAISLLAFLLGDLATSGGTLLNSSKMNVGEVNGETISYNDYLEKVNNLTEVQTSLTGQESLNAQQQETVSANAWEQIASEKAFGSAFDELGLILSDDEILDMADGEYISPVLMQFFANPETGSFDSDAVRRFVTSLDQDPTGKSRFIWNYMEKEMATERTRNKFFTLIQKGVFANNLEVENALEAANTTYDISYAGKSLSAIADSTIKVTEADYKKYYDEHKRLFRQVESREIEYVVFDALPSDSDYAEAEKAAKTLAEELAATDDVAQYVNLNSNTKFVDAYLTREELGANVREFAMSEDNSGVFGPVLESDIYTIARVIDTKTLPDTVGLRQVALAAGSETLADSIVTLLKGKKITFEEAVAQYSLDKQTPGGEIGRIAPNVLVGFGDVLDKVYDSNKGDVFVANTPYGISIMENTYKGNMVEKVKIGVVTYNVEPSERTMRDSYVNATDFANNAKVDFDKAVEANAYSKRVARLSAGENAVSGLENSKEVVRWAFNGAAGDVSEIIAVGESNVVARVVRSSAHGVVALNDVKAQIAPAIIREKKIELLTSELTGSSLEEVASKSETEVKTVSDMNFNTYYIPELGVAQSVIGAMTTLPANTVSKPMPTSSEVVVINVNDVKTEENSTLEAQKVVVQTAMETEVMNRVFSAIYDMADIKDSRIKFF